MEIIEQNIQSKTGNPRDWEDNIVVTDDFACVIDGATSKSSRKIEGYTTGKYVGIIIEKAIHQLNPEANLSEAVDFITEFIRQKYKAKNILHDLKENPQERPAASIALYSRYHHQIWLIGDCQCRTNNIVYKNDKKIDDLLSGIRSLIIELELEKGTSIEELLKNDKGRNFILPLLEKQAILQNNPDVKEFGYGVIDGFDVNKKDIKIINVTGEQIILASDGYPKVFNTLRQSENYLEKVVAKDPLCFRIHPTTKAVMHGNLSYDDRAYLRLKI
jgi:glycerophosphoryl diester phosphodiesterase